MPDRMGWLSPEQAARLWNEVVGLDARTVNRPVSGQMFRKMCREHRMEAIGVHVQEWPGRWYISEYDLLRRLRDHACGACKRAEALLGGAERERE